MVAKSIPQGGPAAIGLAVALTVLAAAPRSSAFCRTMTTPSDPTYAPNADGCITEGLPVYWKGSCIGYSIQRDASRQIPYEDAARIIASAFEQWTTASCPNATAERSTPSIDVRMLEPAVCTEVRYNESRGNQNLIVFRDDEWPHNDPNNTLALTTVIYDLDTGQLYDADMEVNTSTRHLSFEDPVPPNGYDFASIMTHEAGHFFGLAHSSDSHATMNAHYIEGSTSMRTLSGDDIDGICTIYAPDGTRSVANGQTVQAGTCDPTPRHGFTTQCIGPKDSSCAVGRGLGANDASTAAPWALGVLGVVAALARRAAQRRSFD